MDELPPRFLWKGGSPEEETAQFLEQLSTFMDGRQTPLTQPWALEDVPIDARALFEEVCALGGFWEVTNQFSWTTILEKLQVPQFSTTSEEEPTSWEAKAEALKQLYWSNLWAFERVLVHDEPDSSIDYSQQPLEQYDKSTPKTTDDDGVLSILSRGNTTPRTPRTTASDAHMDVEEDGDLEEPEEQGENDMEEDQDGENLNRILTPALELPLPDLSKKKRPQPLNISPEALMELFTARPDQGRPITWRHYLEPSGDKHSVEDFTKTPLPAVSKRLMSRQREGILMHKIERALTESASPQEMDGALKTLVARTWARSFFAALYPTTVERLLRFTKYITQKMTLYQSSSSSLFNLPCDERDGDLSRLLRISTIFRNLAYSQQNVSLLASHLGIVSALCDFCSLQPFLAAVSAHQRHSQHYTLGQIRTLQHHWNDIAIEVPTHLLPDSSNESNQASDKNRPASRPPTLTSALSFLLHLKYDHSASLLQEIQFNAMEALNRIVQVIRFRPLDDAIVDLSQAHDIFELSAFGKDIQRSLPALVELALSTSKRSSAVFLAVELLAKIAMNPNSRTMFLNLKLESLSALIRAMIQYALVDDEMSDWSMLVAYHLSLNAMSLPIAQAICNYPEVVENLMLLVSAYTTVPKVGSSETIQNIAYRRHVLAMRSATILHKLVGFVPLGPTLLKYEHVIADLYLYAPVEIADPMYRVFLEMQS